MSRSPSDLLTGYTEVSSVAMIYDRLNEAINNPGASMSDIGEIIREDVGLTARLLRLVNSAFYGFPQKVETISKALVVVGLQQIRDLALATSVVNSFSGIPESLINMEMFWHHSIACGVAAKILATYRRETNVERFLVAGIVHDIGRLIISLKIPDEAREALVRSKSDGELLRDAEEGVIGFDHAQVGCALLESWNLPLSLQEVAAYHHSPSAAERYLLEAAIVHTADIIVHAMQMGSSGERFVPPLDRRAWERIELPESILSSVLDQVERQVGEVVRTIL